MPTFGVCTSTARAIDAKLAGWDFIEENVQGLFRGTVGDDQYDGQTRVEACPLPVYAANCLVPGAMKIAGPAADSAALQAYMANVLKRAAAANCRLLVFGSGAARTIPDGWDRAKGLDQIVQFGRTAATMAGDHGVTLLLEHLYRGECNVANEPVEQLAIIQRVGHPNFQGLLDTFHLWTENIPLEQVEPLLPHLRHVHVADKQGRVPPGESASSDYRPIFAMLKRARYSGGISVEAAGLQDLAKTARVLAFLKEQWERA